MLATMRAEVSLLYAFRFTKSLAWLVCRLVGLWATTRQTSHANDFANVKSHATTRVTLAGRDSEGNYLS